MVESYTDRATGSVTTRSEVMSLSTNSSVRLHENEIIVPASALQLILRNNNVQLIEQMTRTELRVSMYESIIRVRGSPEAVREVQALIKRLISDEGTNQDMVDYEILPSSSLGLFIGKHGSGLTELEKASGAAIKLETDMCSPLMAILVIKGSLDVRLRAKQIVKMQLEDALNAIRTDRIEMPLSAASGMIGKGGLVIKAINRSSGAMCRIDQETDKANVYIRGNGRQRQRARYLINERVRDMIESDMLNGPRESHLIFARPFPNRGVVSINHSRRHDAYFLDVMADLDDLNPEEERKKNTNTLNMIGVHLPSNNLMFMRRHQNELIKDLLNTITNLASRAAVGQFSCVKIELSFGKQLFRIGGGGGAIPSQFQLPEACYRSNGRLMSEFFQSSKFLDKISDDVYRKTDKILQDNKFQKKERSSAIPTDIYWKHTETKKRYVTKLHVDQEGSATIVRCSDKKFKPIVVTFMHPASHLDFRIRIVVRHDEYEEDIPVEIRRLCESLRLKVEGSHVSVDYPVLSNFAHTCYRLKRKVHYTKGSIKASLHRVYQNHTTVSEPAHLLSPGTEIPQVSKTVISNEISLKNKNLNRLLDAFVKNYDSITEQVEEIVESTNSIASASLSSKQMEKERQLKEDISQELRDLLVAGELITKTINYQF